MVNGRIKSGKVVGCRRGGVPLIDFCLGEGSRRDRFRCRDRQTRKKKVRNEVKMDGYGYGYPSVHIYNNNQTTSLFPSADTCNLDLMLMN